MKVGVLFSGGKDSTYATFMARQSDEVSCLVTLHPERSDSYMFHYPNTRWTSLQAESMGLPQLMFETEGVKEVELVDLTRALAEAKDRYGIEGVYTGALASVYQKSRVDRVCEALDLRSISPLWGLSAPEYLTNLLKSSFEVIITGVASLGLDERWLGRRLDETSIEQLLDLQRKYGLNATLEGGEGETFVLDCPMFKSKIDIISSTRHWDGVSGYLEITEARLTPRSGV